MGLVGYFLIGWLALVVECPARIRVGLGSLGFVASRLKSVEYFALEVSVGEARVAQRYRLIQTIQEYRRGSEEKGC